MTTGDPYRAPPLAPPTSCDRCGGIIARPAAIHEGNLGEPLCQSCFIGQYDLLALFGVGSVIAGAITGSGALLVCGVLVPALGAYAIYKRGI